MKSIIFLIIFAFGSFNLSLAQESVEIYTPKGTPLTAWTNWPSMDPEEQAELYWKVISTYPQTTIIGAATNDYNCHGFAWHYSENDYPVKIGDLFFDEDYETVEDVYWTDTSYIETTEPYASKISYYEGNHSAIQTTTQGIYRSKWGKGPLVQHANNYGPAYYQMDSRKYYKLNLIVMGSSEPMCSVQNRTFSSNISIQGSIYTWSYSSATLNYVSGVGTKNFTIQPKYGVSGHAWVKLQMITPSGEIANSQQISFTVGSDLPDPLFLEIKGENYEFVEHTNDIWEICPNTIYRLQAQGSGISQWDWTFPEDWELLSNENSPEILIETGDNIYWEDEVSVDVYNNACNNWIYWADYLQVSEPPFGCGELLQFNLYPNPAKNTITIQMTENNPQYNSNYTISIVDKSGRVIIKRITKENVINIDISHLQNGEYSIFISNGRVVKSKGLIKSN